MEHVRPAAVAGRFYPDSPVQLRKLVGEFLTEARGRGPVPKALIVPHAGYVYSGPIAASAYARLLSAGPKIERVVLLGPAHRVRVAGLATTASEYFATPLGRMPIDREAVAQALTLPQVCADDRAHAPEHSLEVQLPFLQYVLGNVKLVPFVVGNASADEVAEVLELLWGGRETLIVISSDLSHYHDYGTCRTLDAQTAHAIEALEPDEIAPESACGQRGIAGLLRVARRRGLQAHTVDLRNSGDTAGPRDQVVGYGAFAFEPATINA